MVDKSKFLKIENAALGGTENDPFPTEADPTEDYVAAKGLAIENSDSYLVEKSAGTDIQFKSPAAGTVTLLQTRDAIKLQGRTLASTAPTDGQVVTWNNGASQWEPQAPSIGTFGTQFSQSSVDADSSTTSTTFQQKLRHTTASLPSGTYRIAWYFELRGVSGGKHVEAQVQLNDVTTLARVYNDPDGNTDSEGYLGFSGFYYASSISGVQNIDIDYREGGETNTAHIRRARVEVWRVS